MKQRKSKIMMACGILIGATLISVPAAMAKWPVPNDAPAGSAELQSRRAELVAQSDALLSEVNQQDTECKKVVKGSAKADHCREWKNRLMGRIEKYYADVDAFNREISRSDLHDAVGERRSGSSRASAQLNAAAQSGQEGANVSDAEGASANAGKGFREHNKAAAPIPAFEKSDPQIPDAMLNDPVLGPKIKEIGATRTAHRKKGAEIQQKLEKLNSSNDPSGTQRSKLKQQRDSEKSQVDYANFSISEEIRKWQASKQEKSN